MEQEIFIKTPFIKLGSALKLADLVGSGGMVKMIIQDGLVKLNGETCTMRGKKVIPNDTIEVDLDPNIVTIKVLQEKE